MPNGVVVACNLLYGLEGEGVCHYKPEKSLILQISELNHMKRNINDMRLAHQEGIDFHRHL